MHLRDTIAKVTATDHYGDRLSIEQATNRQRLLMWTRQDDTTNGPDGGYYVFGPKDADSIRDLRDALTQWLDLQ